MKNGLKKSDLPRKTLCKLRELRVKNVFNTEFTKFAQNFTEILVSLLSEDRYFPNKLKLAKIIEV